MTYCAQNTAQALEVNGLSCGYGSNLILSDLSFSLDTGRSLVLLGPNGVGKTTLFKTILGFLPARAGTVRVAGEDVSAWTRRRFAQSVAYVPQTHDVSFAFTVREMVLMGRTPAAASLAGPTRADEEIACNVLDELGLGWAADRDCTTLSGGEMQMVLIARALAQQPQLLVMDEPCANLDWGNQVLVLTRVKRLVDSGLSVLITSHDPNHALLLDSDVLCIGRGFCLDRGCARDVLTIDTLSRLYGVTVGVGQVDDGRGRKALACAPFLDDKDTKRSDVHAR